MKHLVLVAALVAVGSPALADPQVHPFSGTRYATYSLADGTWQETPNPECLARNFFSSATPSGYFLDTNGPDWMVLDWGDTARRQVVGFSIGYATPDVFAPQTFDCVVFFFANDNGYDSETRVPLAAFRIDDLPTADAGGGGDGWVIAVDTYGARQQFVLDGADLDTDGFADFSYAYWLDGLPPSSVAGPIVAGDPTAPGCTGAEDAFDVFTLDVPGDPNSGFTYVATHSVGGEPFAQLHMELFGTHMIGAAPGDSGKFADADLAGDD